MIDVKKFVGIISELPVEPRESENDKELNTCIAIADKLLKDECKYENFSSLTDEELFRVATSLPDALKKRQNFLAMADSCNRHLKGVRSVRRARLL